METIKKRLGEASTNVALGAIFAAWAAYFNGSVGLDSAVLATMGALVTAFLPDTKTTVKAIGALIMVAALSACSNSQLLAANSQAAGLIAVSCQYEPAITGVVGATGNQTAMVTQSFATAFCRNPTVDAQSAAWLKSVQMDAQKQAGIPAPITPPGPAAPAK